MFRFKNMGGTHVQNDAEGKQREYKNGEIVESEYELDVMHGAKFQRLHEPVKPVLRRLESYSLKELTQFASDNGIQVEPGDDKAEIIRALREAGF